MNLIVNVDQNWAIGLGGKLLVTIPEDMKFFREETMGKTVILGRRTLATFPGGKPLAGRRNIVLTRNKSFSVKGAETAHSVEEVLKTVEGTPAAEVYVIGGDSVYKQFLPYCSLAHVTHMRKAYDADTYFPNLEADPEWKLTGESEEKTYFDLQFTFQRYERVGAPAV